MDKLISYSEISHGFGDFGFLVVKEDGRIIYPFALSEGFCELKSSQIQFQEKKNDKQYIRIYTAL